MSTANIKISQLPELSTMIGNAVMPVVANGVTQKISGANLANFFGGNGNNTPGGSNRQVQFNDNGSFAGSANFTFNKTSNVFTVPGNIVPVSNNTASLGTALNQWKDLYVSNATIYMNNVPLTLTSTNILTIGGNAVLTNGSDTTVSTTGNITANYFIGNGSLLTGIGGGGGNTGNVTFNDQVIQGTGTQDGGGGLYLAPAVESTANLQYLRVRGGDYVTHIHMDTGNGAFFDQYFGADLKYVKLAANGNVVINTSDFLNGGSNSATWNFSTDGNLTLPNNANIATIGNVTQINTGANGFLSLNSFDAGGNNIARAAVDSIDKAVFIAVSDPAAEIDYTWAFGNGGGTIFPTLDVQRGDNPSGTITGQTLLFGNPLQEAIISTPDGYSEAEYSQRLVINPGSGYNFGEGGDIYLWAGRGGNGSGSGGDIKIRGGQGGANTMGGAGGSGGYIRIEAGDAATTGGVPGYIAINGGVNYIGAGGYVAVQGGQGQTIGGDANIRGGYGFDDRGGNVNIWGGSTGNGQVNEGHVNIQTGGNTWTFGPDGRVAIPGAIVGNGNLYLQPDPANTGAYLDIYLTYGPDIHIAKTDSNVIIGGDSAANVTVNAAGNVSIQSWNGTAHIWDFNADGNLSLPANIVHGNARLSLHENNSNTAYLTSTTDDSSALYIDATSAQLYSSSILVTGSGNNGVYIGTGNTRIVQDSADASQVGNIELRTSLNNQNYAWTFDSTGNLITPGAIIGAGSNVELVAGTATYTFDTANNVTFANGAKLNGGTANQFATDNTVVSSLDLRDTAGAGFYTNGSGYTLRSNGTYNWVFDTTGTLTMPGPTQLAVYANTAVRDSAIPSPSPGMMIYVTGTGMQVRGATSWNTIAGSGT